MAKLIISIHAPAWGATHGARGINKTIRNFNPRARVGRDGRIMALRKRGEISIHAPAWGATHRFGSCQHRQLISIHAPAWGATEDGNIMPKAM